ncbi:MAG: NYN domain-containing protein [Patescibacteria group bacterium]
MHRQLKNYAFIDSQNLNLAIRSQGWKLDFKRFQIYLRDKYNVGKAYLFIGYISGNETLYAALQDFGYTCIFKPTLQYNDGTTKGNCDAELVLWSMIEFTNYEKAVIVTGDGDFHCLVDHLLKQQKLECVLIPDRDRFSALLKFKQFRSHLRYMNDLRDRLHKKERAP